MVPLLYLCLAAVAAATTNTTKDASTEQPKNVTKEILTPSETSDPSTGNIVKQIRRLNDDGSYTVGYEAGDGTFKIESRDVLGNVKGTFGYIDKDGEIKRVTYTSSSDPTPVPVTTSTTSSTPSMIVRVNKTVSTTRRPLGTVVYPSRASFTTRSPIVQSTLRRRTTTTSVKPTTQDDVTTERKHEDSSNILNLYKPKEDSTSKTRTQILKPMPVASKDDLVTKQTTTIKPVHEDVDEKPEVDPNKANTIRRQLSETSPNHHMLNLQQSIGDDSTDVYGSHLSMGTVRPLFTTTTPRPRLVPIQSLVAARQRIQQQYQRAPQEQETTIEASTGRVFDHENVVTSNPVPVVHIPARTLDERLYHQEPIYRRPTAAIQFRSHDYMKENPGAPIPIGNQRPFLQYELQNKVLEPQYVRDSTPASQTKETNHETATVPQYEVRPVTRIIHVPVDERGVPIQGYQPRYVNPYRPQLFQPRYDPVEEMNQIQAPVSTRDLKRLLQILIHRQNRLQALMDQIVAPGPPYQPLPAFRQEQPFDYRYQQRQYEEESRYDNRYDQQYRQQEYQPNYENPQYESQRYVPRRRLYTRPAYDSAGAASNHIDEPSEFLPPEIREALLLKMLLLAISPDFMPTPVPATELTTAAPARKQVRNVQILGEEGSAHDKTEIHRQ